MEKQNISAKEWETIYEALSKPFPPELIEFKPQVGGGYGSTTALAYAHADPRAYIDRLNKVIGIGGWETTYSFTTVPYTEVKKQWAKKGEEQKPDVVTSGHKVLCVCSLSIYGVVRSSTKEEDSDDKNAATTPESLAFKRACMTFGLGRYLYDLPLVEAPYDSKTKKWIQEPVLPDWAIPPYECDDCHADIKAGEYNGKEIPIARLVAESKKNYSKNICYACQKVRKQAITSGRGITA